VGLIFGATIFAASGTYAGENPCSSSPLLVGQCFEVHGRLALYNGNPSVRIWRVGTKYLLGVLDANGHPFEDFDLLPPGIRKLIPASPAATAIYGDYLVCPFERVRPGWMQSVCIAGAKHLVDESPK
jgi:hypothetical protein